MDISEDTDALKAFDETVSAMRPARNEVLSVVHAIVQYGSSATNVSQVHQFFERAVRFHHPPPEVTRSVDTACDNYRFFTHELFLSTIAISLKSRDFALAQELLTAQYYVPSRADRSSFETQWFSRAIQSDVRLVSARVRGTNWISHHGQVLKENACGSLVTFEQLMQADFVCLMRAAAVRERWWPETLPYAVHRYNAFEIFSRAKSQAYGARVLKVLGLSNSVELGQLVAKIAENSAPRFDYETLPVELLAGIKQWGTSP